MKEYVLTQSLHAQADRQSSFIDKKGGDKGTLAR